MLGFTGAQIVPDVGPTPFGVLGPPYIGGTCKLKITIIITF